MLDKAVEIIDDVAKITDKVILFHSLSGKDSIALLDLVYPRFKKVTCVYMYVVKDLRHINRYLAYANRMYPDVEWIQMPHYSVFSDIRTGYLGRKQNTEQRQYTLSDLTDIVRGQTNTDWVCFGFKKSDSLNRRLMLGTYRLNAINDTTKKFYPLSEYLNKDILSYITREGLIQPEKYGPGQSSGCDIGDVNYLVWLRSYYPDDLERILRVYPHAERLIFEYDYGRTEKEEKAQ